MSSLSLNKLKRRTPSEVPEKPRKKIDRFDGMSEEELQKYTLPDYLEMNLDMVFVGINPSLTAAHKGRYYAGPGNHFYKLLHESGLTPRFISFDEDYKLPRFGIGLTNIVTRPTRSSAELKRTELKEGSKVVEEKLRFYKPKIAVFNGKCIYEAFANKTGKSDFHFGLQPESVGESAIWVVPSSSARCAHLPRMVDKLHFYTALKKYLQFVKGEIEEVDKREFLFEGKCKQFIPSTSKMWRRKNVSAFLHGGRIANKDTVCLDTSDDNVAIAHSTEFIVTRIKSDTNDTEEEKSQLQNLEENVVGSQETENKTASNNNLENDTVIINKTSESNTSNNFQSVQGKKCNTGQNSLNFKSVKTCRKRISPVLTQRIRNNEAEHDFVSLIKQRLSQKEDKTDENIKKAGNEKTRNIAQQKNNRKRRKSLRLKVENLDGKESTKEDTDLCGSTVNE